MRMNSGFYIHRILDLFIKITGIKKRKKKTAYYFANIPPKALFYLGFGGDEGDRTPDLLNAIALCSQKANIFAYSTSHIKIY